ncbi:azolemycin family RiPP peptide [Streptomyces ficellus]|uniref:Azolemycin family RiPP peptide n=1 Tax=Streptomyces ficellus TaxID=1977088 RepID=A0ABT7Z664_9ACTN|nr:azolemycin family RiPP peptide [Streptomyces ficellus]MDN3294916.1 azolemycin family RiPP peptide [Streptomyces ficellus]
MEDINDLFEEMAVPEPEVTAACHTTCSSAVSDGEERAD